MLTMRPEGLMMVSPGCDAPSGEREISRAVKHADELTIVERV